MNYAKIYDQLITKRRDNPITEGYAEAHHIIPRCFGGSNAKSNIVRLTAREHFVAHLLLAKIYPGPSMLHAIRMMGIRSKRHKGRRDFIPNSWNYQIAKVKLSEIQKQFVTVRDKSGKCFTVCKDDPRYLSGELVHVATGTAKVEDKFGKCFSVDINDPRYLSGELVHISKGKTTFVDLDGNVHYLPIDDPKVVSGEFKGIWSGRKHSAETIERMKRSSKGKHVGDKNSQFGTMWIHNPELQQNKKISKGDPIPTGWVKGRKTS